MKEYYLVPGNHPKEAINRIKQKEGFSDNSVALNSPIQKALFGEGAFLIRKSWYLINNNSLLGVIGDMTRPLPKSYKSVDYSKTDK